MEPVPDNSAPCLSRCLQVQTLHGILRDLFSAAVGRGSPDLPPPQRECPGNHESECQRAAPYRRLFLPDLCEFAGWLCLLRNPAGRTATRFTRSEKQCLTSGSRARFLSAASFGSCFWRCFRRPSQLLLSGESLRVVRCSDCFLFRRSLAVPLTSSFAHDGAT